MSNMILVALLSLFCLVSHLVIQRSPATPGVAHGALWLLISMGYAFVLGDLSIVSTRTLLVLTIGVAAFSTGIHIGTRLTGRDWQPRESSGKQFPVPMLIVLVSAIGLAMMLNKASEYAMVHFESFNGMDLPIGQARPLFGGYGSWYDGLRAHLNAHRGGSFGAAGYVLNFSFAGTAYLLLHTRRLGATPWLVPSIALSLGFSILSTGRTYLVLLGCIVIAVVMPASRRQRLVLGLAAPLVGGLLLILATLMSGRLDITSVDSLLVSLEQSNLKRYALTAVGALDILVNSDLPATAGSMTFRTPFAVLRFLGVQVAVPEMLQPNVTFAGFVVNIYTVFSPYYRDFGLLGVGLFMATLGSLHGWVFRQLKSGLPIFVVANALLFYALLMQFFQDQYFSLMSQWVQILGWTYLFVKLQPLPCIREQDRC